jgi:hypothetical protein
VPGWSRAGCVIPVKALLGIEQLRRLLESARRGTRMYAQNTLSRSRDSECCHQRNERCASLHAIRSVAKDVRFGIDNNRDNT